MSAKYLKYYCIAYEKQYNKAVLQKAGTWLPIIHSKKYYDTTYTKAFSNELQEVLNFELFYSLQEKSILEQLKYNLYSHNAKNQLKNIRRFKRQYQKKLAALLKGVKR